MVRATLLPPAGQAQSPGLMQVLDLLERHCLAPDGSLLVKSAYRDLLEAREEMAKERLRCFEAMAVYSESVALMEEYHQALSMANAGGIRDLQTMFSQLGLKCVPQVYDALEQRLAVAEAAQCLRLPLISKDGEIPDEDAEKWSIICDKWSAISRSSFDSTSTTSISTNTTVTSMNTCSTNPSTAIGSGANVPPEVADPSIGGMVNRFLGLNPAWLRQIQLNRSPYADDSTGYQMALIPEIESRLRFKCEKLTKVFEADEPDSSGLPAFKSNRLAERVKLAVEAVETEEQALLEDLFSADRKFSEYYNVLEQILGVLLRLVKDYKLNHQFEYDGMRKAWLCKRCQTMNTKLSVLEHLLLRDTYTQESIPALHKIRGHLVDAVEEASAAYNRAVTRLREYQGVDQYFDDIARRYHDLVTKLEGIQWTIRQVEMDLNNNSHDYS